MVQVYHNPNFELDSKAGHISSWENCIHVAEVKTENLEEALIATKNDGEINFKKHLAIYKIETTRSTTEGDILVLNNQKYLVERFGFLALDEKCQLINENKTTETPKQEMKRNRPKLRL